MSLKVPHVLEYPTTYPIDARLSLSTPYVQSLRLIVKNAVLWGHVLARRAGLHQIKYHLESNNYVAGFQYLLLLLDLDRKKWSYTKGPDSL